MGATRSQIVTRVLNLLSNSSMIDSDDAVALVQAEHVSITEDFPWSRRKKDTVLTTVAPYSDGSIAISSTTVTGTSTTFTSSMVGRFLRTGGNPYFHKITAFTSTTSLTLEEAPPADVSAGAEYTIFKHVYALPSDFGRVLAITSDTKVREWARADIDRVDAYRTSTASYPVAYSVRGPDSSGIFEIEFWPVPSAATNIRVEYAKTNLLSDDSSEPLYRTDVLVWKAAEAGAFFLHGKTGDAAWLALADRFHVRYAEELQGAKEDDLGRWSAVEHVRDTAYDDVVNPGDDFWMQHDGIGLR